MTTCVEWVSFSQKEYKALLENFITEKHILLSS